MQIYCEFLNISLNIKAVKRKISNPGQVEENCFQVQYLYSQKKIILL